MGHVVETFGKVSSNTLHRQQILEPGHRDVLDEGHRETDSFVTELFQNHEDADDFTEEADNKDDSLTPTINDLMSKIGQTATH